MYICSDQRALNLLPTLAIQITYLKELSCTTMAKGQNLLEEENGA